LSLSNKKEKIIDKRSPELPDLFCGKAEDFVSLLHQL
jgi:hypothetical protein